MTTLRNRLRRRAAALLQAGLVCVLLAAQAMAYAHGLDAERHAAGDACEICITIGGLGGSAPAKAPAAVAISAPGIQLPGYAEPCLTNRCYTHRFARGPPIAS